MGATLSSTTPPPLVHVLAPGGKVLVPPHTTFKVHPAEQRDRVPRRRRGVTPIPPDWHHVEDNSVDGESLGGRGVRARMLERRMNERPCTMPLGSGIETRYGGFRPGIMGPGPRGLRPRCTEPLGGMDNIPSGMSYPDLPPGYTPIPPRYTPNLVGGISGVNPYAFPLPSDSTSSSISTPSNKHLLRHPHGQNEHIPMGAFTRGTATPKPTRPSTSDRTQPNNHEVGPSAKEWFKGDPFLDACICTKNCKCRSGHRVLYRSRSSSPTTSSSTPHYRSGEIRYILKIGLGEDCGDHSKFTRKMTETNTESREERKKREERKRVKRQFDGFKEDVLDAVDERIELLRKSGNNIGMRSSPREGGAQRPPAVGVNPYAMDISQGPRDRNDMVSDAFGAQSMRAGHQMGGSGPFGEDVGFHSDLGGGGTASYSALGSKSKGLQPSFLSSGQQKTSRFDQSRGMHARGSGRGIVGGGRRRRDTRFCSEDFGTEKGDCSIGGVGVMSDKLGDEDDEDELRGRRRMTSHTRRGVRRQNVLDVGRGRQARVDTDDDDFN